MTRASRELVAAIAGECPHRNTIETSDLWSVHGPSRDYAVMAATGWACDGAAIEDPCSLEDIDCPACRLAIFKALDPMRLDTLLERGVLKPLEPEARAK